MKIYNELESLGFFEWLSETYNLKDTDMKPEYLDELPLNDIHRTVGNSMALRWFRENYNLFGHVEVEGDNSFYWHIRNPEQFISSQTSDTYEEAESACLDKLIEICRLSK